MKCGFLFSNFGHDRCCCRGLRMERTLPPGPPQKMGRTSSLETVACFSRRRTLQV